MTRVPDSAVQGWIVAGIGCDRQTSVAEIQALLQDCLRIAAIEPGRLCALATVALKADEPGLLVLAERLNLPLKVFSVAELEAETPRLANPSAAVFRAIGCHGVAEAAALAAVGPAGQLLLPKRRSARATCALAISAVEPFV
jgi:cobalt-precorrin 5A hydrolase/precorrin-3B C17-methyltransferase